MVESRPNKSTDRAKALHGRPDWSDHENSDFVENAKQVSDQLGYEV